MTPDSLIRLADEGAHRAYLAQLKRGYDKADLIELAKTELRALLDAALAAAVKAGRLPAGSQPFAIEQPADAKNGDLSSNLAMVSARALAMPPRKIAEAVLEHLPLPKEGVIERAEIAGPGFLNFYLSAAWYAAPVMAACACGEDYGRSLFGAGEKVNVEFVSANPTGPMHLGNARGGALGDCLAAVMQYAGYEVCREFYINDAGNQIAKFGRSLAARYLGLIRGEDAVPFPEDGYQGEDIRARAAEFRALRGGAPAALPQEELESALIAYALPENIRGLKDDLAKYRISYDVWFSESSLHQSGAVREAVRRLTQRGATYEKEGAVWFKSEGESEGEAARENVLVRANGVPTYFAADIAYHIGKIERGFTTLIDVWGADHHGHVARMKSALAAAGYGDVKLDIVLMQFVRLVQGGQPVRMSKRTGKAITLTDLLDEVPIDSARFFFNQREPGSAIEFDLDLAVSQDSNNPVYYVQYAHARVCSILRGLSAEGVLFSPPQGFAALAGLTGAEERELIRKTAAFPGEIKAAAAARDPSRITRYLIDTATQFHRFYTACRIKGEAPDRLQARLALALAAKTVLANGLAMLKVTAPQQM